MYRCIIIDDEEHAVQGMRNYIKDMPDLKVIRTYNDPLKALNEILSGEIFDLLFLDIDMPQMSGIDLAKEIRHKTNKLIFTTGHIKYGYEAFEVEADAYLLKPFSVSKFIAIVTKVLHKDKSRLKDGLDFFFVKSKEDNLKLLMVRYSDVIAVESSLNYVIIHIPDRKILTYMSLTEIFNVLSKYPGFVKFQRSFIVAVDHIQSIDGNCIMMRNGVKVTVGESYKELFYEFISSKIISSKTKRKEK